MSTNLHKTYLVNWSKKGRLGLKISKKKNCPLGLWMAHFGTNRASNHVQYGFFSRNLSHYVVRIFHIILEKLEGQFFHTQK